MQWEGEAVAGISLDLEDLLLDLENPRIRKADSQRGAIQLIEDKDLKLVVWQKA